MLSYEQWKQYEDFAQNQGNLSQKYFLFFDNRIPDVNVVQLLPGYREELERYESDELRNLCGEVYIRFSDDIKARLMGYQYMSPDSMQEALIDVIYMMRG